MSELDECRKAFEAWFRIGTVPQLHEFCLRKSGRSKYNGQYVREQTETLWQGFQAGYESNKPSVDVEAVERVARALAVVDYQGGYHKGDDKYIDETWGQYITQAKAAIQAMRHGEV